ncbi:type I-D CRISPR-associated protein Cas10d/Csc3 [Methanosarcina sp.]|uniref:type I-D CRISPR-associated protein Cas10d/Csc3 n=1 Tax=Methanosarcina sp. TaxID=2213 RepID=UPI003BB746BB
MVSDALQDQIRSRKVIQDLSLTTDERKRDNTDLFEEYLKEVDIHLVEMGMAFKAAKSVEFGKTDQSMLNHIRAGILFLLRFNEALQKLNILSLDKERLRDCMALFVVHDLHKLKYEEFMDEGLPEEHNHIEYEFEIPKEAVLNFVNMTGLRKFAPSLRDEDYFSVAVALHKSRFSRSGARTSRFMDMESFLYLMDNMASCSSPEEAASIRSLTALRDGFPQNSPEEQLNFQYHLLDDVKGILTGIVNKSVADLMEANDLIMLMAYQDGCVYLGRGMQHVSISEECLEKIYHNLEKNIQQSTPALSDSELLTRELKTPRLGDYGLSDEYYFFSGPDKMLRAFISKAITSSHSEKTTDLSDSITEGIHKVEEIVPIKFEESKDGRKILLEFSRAVASVHKTFVSEMFSDNRQALLKTCEIWEVPEDVKNSLLKTMDEKPSYLANGGKWEYSYAIGQCVINQEYNGVKLRNTDIPAATNYIVSKIWNKLINMEQWGDFISKKTGVYHNELMEYLHDVLSINGTIILNENSDLSDTFNEYESSGKICDLCNRGTLLRKEKMKNTNSFLSFNFTNRVFVGKTKPDNIRTCIPCGIELALRMNGFNTSKAQEILYFHFIPDYFFTPESWDLVETIFTKFSDEARVRTAELARKIFNSKYASNEPTKEGNVDIYDSWIRSLVANIKEDEKAKGLNMFQYMTQGYLNNIGNASVVFYKPSKNVIEFHFFGVYIAMVIAAYTGMRVIVSKSPISAIRGRDFKEMIALDSINSHVTEFYGKFITLSHLEDKLKASSALISLGYKSSGMTDSLFPKFLRIVRDEKTPGSHLLKMVYRNSDSEFADLNVRDLLDEALFLDNITEVKK